MIIDNIENISKYNCFHPYPLGDGALAGEFESRPNAGEENLYIPEKVINFLKTLSSDTPVGHYEIDENIYANVDEYLPKPYENCKFEAHKKYIDIQMMLKGEENLEYTTINGLKISEEYDENKDVMFFVNSKSDYDVVKLTPFKFVFIFPHEAHKPQIKTTSGNVKKIVVKIKLA